jgi:hypothetical protein
MLRQSVVSEVVGIEGDLEMRHGRKFETNLWDTLGSDDDCRDVVGSASDVATTVDDDSSQEAKEEAGILHSLGKSEEC